MTTRATAAIAAALACAACGETAEPPAPPPTAAATTPAAGAGNAAAVHAGGAWIDPEPPEAQAIAEQNAKSPWNADKVTGLVSSMTVLDRSTTTGIVGGSTGIAAATTTVDERLSRLKAETTETEITIRLPGSVLFDFDSDRIRADAERTLAEVAEVLKAYAQRPMRIEGHTDSVASDQYNQQLSERRAKSVRDWLAGQGGVKAALSTRGWGESKPAAANDTPAGRQQNRRVEVIIEKGS